MDLSSRKPARLPEQIRLIENYKTDRNSTSTERNQRNLNWSQNTESGELYLDEDQTYQRDSTLTRDLLASDTFSIPRKPVRMATVSPNLEHVAREQPYQNIVLENHDIEGNPLSTNEKLNATAELDWDSPWDLNNPRNWPFWERCFATAIPAIACFVVASSASIYVPGTISLTVRPGPQKLKDEFHVTETETLLGLSLFVLGLGFGPMLGAPISETRGRKIVYLVSLPLFALCTMGVALSKTFSGVLALRFFAGVFGSPCLAVGAGTIADIWDFGIHGGTVGPVFLIMAFIGPAMGPFIGGHIVESKSWRWTMWTTLFMSLVPIVASLFTRETYKKVILTKRAAVRGIPLPPRPPPKEAIKMLFTVTLFRPVAMIFLEPIIIATSIYNGFCFAVLFSFFEAIPYVFRFTYGFSTGDIGNVFLGVGLGIIFSTITAIMIDHRIYQKERIKALQKHEIVAPEHRLYAALLGSLLLPISMFWFALSARTDIHWIMPSIGGVWFGWGVVSAFIGTAEYLIEAYDAMAGASGLAANSLVRYSLGATFPLFTIQLYTKLGIPWAGSLIGFIALALVPIPWLLFKYGARLRAKSRYKLTTL